LSKDKARANLCFIERIIDVRESEYVVALRGLLCRLGYFVLEKEKEQFETQFGESVVAKSNSGLVCFVFVLWHQI